MSCWAVESEYWIFGTKACLKSYLCHKGSETVIVQCRYSTIVVLQQSPIMKLATPQFTNHGSSTLHMYSNQQGIRTLCDSCDIFPKSLTSRSNSLNFSERTFLQQVLTKLIAAEITFKAQATRV